MAPAIATAQFKSATIGIDGLTCSMCSYSVQRSIEKLDFVSDVIIDLNSNIAQVEFKEEEKANIRKLIRSVFDAGFSVRDLKARFNLKSTVFTNGSYFHFEDYIYIILGIQRDIHPGEIELKFVDKSFTDHNDYKKYRDTIEKSQQQINLSYYFVII